MRLFRLIFCCLGLLPATCSPPRLVGTDGAARPPGSPGTGGAGGGAATTDGGPSFTLPDPPDGAAAVPANPPPGSGPGTTCGFQRYQLERLPPELLLVLDRSGSMLEPADTSLESRWTETTAALIDVLGQTEGTISWGMKSFPNPVGCLVTPTVEVEIGASSAPTVAFIRNTLPNERGSGTPTGEALQGATTYLRTRVTPNAKFMVLATDGVPACPLNDLALSEQKALAAVTEAMTAGIPTFVIGIATADTDADRILGELARAGGQPRRGAQPYYPVEDRRGLFAALAEIRKVVASCTFYLEKAPPSPDDVAVDVDGVRIVRDPARMNGWNYSQGNRSITLHGGICERVKSGQARDVNIIFGCPAVPIP
jgi:hypothetical protein